MPHKPAPKVYLVDAKLDDDVCIQSTIVDWDAGTSIARDMALRQMVVRADLLNVETGEVRLVFTRFTVRNYLQAHNLGKTIPGSGGVSPA